ncbi:hypothetical protein ACFORJ_12625 [Corynebacterium hansenii]|uniref:ABC transporter permease n=1 Tax=Corynebacterium hansenii TaxID=394964 RepID=A0ABV7ZUW8_9CORY|nr:hypothetical protein [Corynebacterium hansenii]WJY99721.1 ABC-2 family transporter protein [Corynebacterium hansenii]
MTPSTIFVLLGRQFRALRASWATWALAAAAVFFALVAPVTARYLREILGGVLGGSGGEVPIDVGALPDPSVADAWAQWASNLSQVIVVIVAIVAASAISADVSRGTAVPLLARPVTRAGLWGTAFAAVCAVVAAVAVISTAVMIGVTALLFDDLAAADLRAPIGGSAAWLFFAASLVAVTMAASGAGATALGATAAGIGYFALTAAAGLSPALVEWGPSGLLMATAGKAGTGAFAVTAAIAAAAIAIGIAAFRRREL